YTVSFALSPARELLDKFQESFLNLSAPRAPRVTISHQEPFCRVRFGTSAVLISSHPTLLEGDVVSSQRASKPTPIRETRSDARSSTRIGQTVPLIVSGLDRIGQKFLEQTSAVTINCHGCRYPSRYAHQPGSWIALGILDQEAKSKPSLVRAQ